MTHEHPEGFSLRLEFTTLAQFAEFVAILKGDGEQIRQTAARLEQQTESLAQAVQENTPTPTT